MTEGRRVRSQRLRHSAGLSKVSRREGARRRRDQKEGGVLMKRMRASSSPTFR